MVHVNLVGNNNIIMNAPFLSIVIFVRDLPQLFSLTMDSILKQSFKDFEIIVIDQVNKEEIFDPYSDQIEHIEVILEGGLGYLMQSGLEKAKGKYIQFLLTGDSFLGENALNNLFSNLKKDPDLIFCSYIKRDIDTLPYVEKFPFSRRFLAKGILPSRFESILIKTAAIYKVKGVDIRYNYRPNLNLLSKLFLKKNKYVEFNRVIVDCEMRKKPTTDLFRRFIETYLVIEKNFGRFASLKWLLSQNYISLLSSIYNKTKKAFYGR